MLKKSGCTLTIDKQGCMGLLAADGRELLPCIYDEVMDFDGDGYIRFLQDGVYGTVDFEGNVVIPHSLGLTHLGVFHGGTARAQRNGLWGLVDERGQEFCPFAFDYINAFHKGVYQARTLDNRNGTLTTQGLFTAYGTDYAHVVQPPYQPEVVREAKWHCMDTDGLMKSVTQMCSDLHRDFEEGGLTIYYRDTDTLPPTPYRRGMVLVADDDLEVSRRVRRCVHKLRIALLSFDVFTALDAGTEFVVIDIQRLMGVTQVVLMPLRNGIMGIAARHGCAHKVAATVLSSGQEYASMAREELQIRMEDHIHGHSLLAEWQDAMSVPVGYNSQLRRVPVKPCDTNPFGVPSPHTLRIVVGDITRLQVDGIVCAANGHLLGDSGLAAAISKAAGPKLAQACAMHHGCHTGRSKITDAFRLPCSRVIHSVGPVWQGGKHGEDGKLASCYATALRLAHKHRLRSIAFPCISTGAHGFPAERAARIALRTLADRLTRSRYRGDVVICCATQHDAEIYADALKDIKDFH